MKPFPVILFVFASLGLGAQAADPKVISADQLVKSWQRPMATKSASAAAAPPAVKLRVSKSAVARPNTPSSVAPSGGQVQTRMHVQAPGLRPTAPSPSTSPSAPRTYVRVPSPELRPNVPSPSSSGSRNQIRVQAPVNRPDAPSQSPSAPRTHVHIESPMLVVDEEVKVDAASGASFNNIQFQLDSADLTGHTTFAQLAEIAKAMQMAEGSKFLIEGHTCDRGSDLHNQDLSLRRAWEVREVLTGMGVPAERLQVMGFGENDPAVPNRDEMARLQNRRVQIYRKL